MTPRLDVRDLTVIAGARGSELRVLREVTFEVAPGEILGLIGESGCGKSVTLLGVLGLLPTGLRIRGGSVRLDGMELVGAPPKVLREVRGRRVAIVFQDPQNSLNPALRVGYQVGESLRIHGLSEGKAQLRRRTLELLEEVGIPDPELRAGQYPHQLSGGLQQRAVIAAALAAGPDLLLADEPTTALDVTIQRQIMALLRGLSRSRGCGVVLVTHNLALAARSCDRVAVMYAGRVVEQGTASEIVHRAAHPYTKGLLASLPRLGGGRSELEPIPGEVPAIGDVPPAGCAFAARCGHARAECREGAIDLRAVSPGHRARCVLVPWR